MGGFNPIDPRDAYLIQATLKDKNSVIGYARRPSPSTSPYNSWRSVSEGDFTFFSKLEAERYILTIEKQSHIALSIIPASSVLGEPGVAEQGEGLGNSKLYNKEEEASIVEEPCEEIPKTELELERERTASLAARVKRLENDKSIIELQLKTQQAISSFRGTTDRLDNKALDAVEAAQEACNKLHPQSKIHHIISSGKKTDVGKLRWHLLPFDAVREIVKVLDLNAEPTGKYEERNWEKGIAYSRLYSAIMRHITAWFQYKEDKDSESGLSHLAHAACCILFLLAYTLREKNEIDDRPETK